MGSRAVTAKAAVTYLFLGMAIFGSGTPVSKLVTDAFVFVGSRSASGPCA